MGSRLRIILSTIILPLLVTPILGAEFTHKEYAKAPEEWRRAFVSGIAHSLMTVPQPDEQSPYPVRAAFQRCLNHASESALAQHVQTYVAAHPGNLKGPMMQVVMRAMFELCQREIPKTLPARGLQGGGGKGNPAHGATHPVGIAQEPGPGAPVSRIGIWSPQ
jgi:hypothetical protein